MAACAAPPGPHPSRRPARAGLLGMRRQALNRLKSQRKRACAKLAEPAEQPERGPHDAEPIITAAAVAVTGRRGRRLHRLPRSPGRPRRNACPSPPGRSGARATWPFPIDQWGQGWAYRCKAADCGTEVDLYLRPKIGFCNCQTGVADDAELDRVGDVELFGGESSALGPGRPITVHGMKGRSRGYAVGAPPARSVLSFAFNNRCDVVRRHRRRRRCAGRARGGRARVPQRRFDRALGRSGARALVWRRRRRDRRIAARDQA